MPPYVPDENPIEHVGDKTKQAVANIQRNQRRIQRLLREIPVPVLIFVILIWGYYRCP